MPTAALGLVEVRDAAVGIGAGGPLAPMAALGPLKGRNVAVGVRGAVPGDAAEFQNRRRVLGGQPVVPAGSDRDNHLSLLDARRRRWVEELLETRLELAALVRVEAQVGAALQKGDEVVD